MCILTTQGITESFEILENSLSSLYGAELYSPTSKIPRSHTLLGIVEANEESNTSGIIIAQEGEGLEHCLGLQSSLWNSVTCWLSPALPVLFLSDQCKIRVD